VSNGNKRGSSDDADATIVYSSLFFNDSQYVISNRVRDKNPSLLAAESSLESSKVLTGVPAALDCDDCGGKDGMICTVSGIDASSNAKSVFVWCRDKSTGTNLLILTGRVVGSSGDYVPPGVSKGQFRLTFIISGQYSTDDIYVTADKNGERFLADVAVEIPRSAPAGLRRQPLASLPMKFEISGSAPAGFFSGVPITASDLPAGAAGPSRSANRGQIIVIRSTESET
jgi:hypothetical protein